MPNIVVCKVLADMAFASKQLKMPPKDSWKAPQQEGKESKDNYTNGVGKSNWGPGIPAADGVVNYFATQDNHKYHMQLAQEMTKTYKNFIYAQLDACSFAFNLWRMTLTFNNLKINGPTVVGSKGCLKANGDFANLYKTYPGHAQFAMGKYYAKWRDAVGKGVGKCLKNYVDGVLVTGFPWYPAYAAFPGPVAAPMPNVPWPLISCTSTGLADITTPAKLKKAMLDAFDSGCAEKCHDNVHEAVYEAIATALAPAFLVWVSTQMINTVMGSGNIPTFAPPWVPVGPVLNGQNIPSPAGNLLP